MVMTALEVDGAVGAMVAMPLEFMVVAVAMVAEIIPVVVMVIPGPVLVPLRGSRTGEQHDGDGDGDQTCDPKLHGRTLIRYVHRLYGVRRTGSEAGAQLLFSERSRFHR
jgi:hypothetical protein